LITLISDFITQQVPTYINEHKIQLFKFVLVGITTSGVNLTNVYIFYGLLQWDYRLAITIAYIVAVLCHFLLHRVFTFRAGNQQIINNAGKYSLMLLVNYGITLTAVLIAVEILGSSPYFGVIGAVGITAFTSFFLMKYFVFQTKKVILIS